MTYFLVVIIVTDQYMLLIVIVVIAFVLDSDHVLLVRLVLLVLILWLWLSASNNNKRVWGTMASVAAAANYQKAKDDAITFLEQQYDQAKHALAFFY
jgi:hypothetical protein